MKAIRHARPAEIAHEHDTNDEAAACDYERQAVLDRWHTELWRRRAA